MKTRMFDRIIHLFRIGEIKFKAILRTSLLARRLREFWQQRRFSPSPVSRLVNKMHMMEIESVIDIGANVGQFGLDLRMHGYRGKIFSFEPIPDIAEKLRKTALKHPPWDVFEVGLGSKTEQRLIHVSSNSALSSSFLEMLPNHLSAFPNSGTKFAQRVQVSKLDELVPSLKLDCDKTLIKIDVQGFESEVLRGGRTTISKVPMCYFEASVVPLYSGESSLINLLNQFSLSGHEVEDIFRGVTGLDGQLLQVDIITSKRIEF